MVHLEKIQQTILNRENVLLDILFEEWDTGTWINNAQDFYSYDENDYVVEILTKAWTGTEWINAMKTIITNNDDGYPLENLMQMWDPVNGIWTNYYIMFITYDANNNAIETLMQIWYIDDWLNFMYITMTYNASNYPIEMIRQEWDMGAGIWVNDERNTFTYDGDDMIELLDEDWENGAWVNKEIELYTYDGAGHALERFKDSWQGGAWVNYLWNQYSYDGNWNEIEDWVQIWQGGAWANHEMYLQSWNANNQVTEKIEQVWENSAWVNDERETYTYGEAGVEGEVPPEIVGLSNYPNPFNPSTTISFELNTENTEDTEIEIYNLKGQKIRQYSIFPEQSQAPYGSGNSQSSIVWDGTDQHHNQVSSGIYLYRIKIDDFVSETKKMILMK